MATLVNRNGWWHLNWMDGGVRHTKSLKTKDETEARDAKGVLERRLRLGHDAVKMLSRFGDVPPPVNQPRDLERLLLGAPRLFTYCRKNAAARRIAFALDVEAVRHLFRESGGYCMVSGIPFDEEFKVGGRRPFAPSIDRADCDGPYSIANCRLVCIAVNQALHTWGPAVLYRLVDYMAPRVRSAR